MPGSALASHHTLIKLRPAPGNAGTAEIRLLMFMFLWRFGRLTHLPREYRLTIVGPTERPWCLASSCFQ